MHEIAGRTFTSERSVSNRAVCPGCPVTVSFLGPMRGVMGCAVAQEDHGSSGTAPDENSTP